MPELPQVEALRGWLADRLVGRAVIGVQLVDFAALKTYQPPLDALLGLEITDVARHGKFIDVDAQGVHLVFHLARAGWLTWKDAQPTTPARPGRPCIDSRPVVPASLVSPLSPSPVAPRSFPVARWRVPVQTFRSHIFYLTDLVTGDNW